MLSNPMTQGALALGSLLLVSLAAEKVGLVFKRFKLPLISGYLAVGIIAGPFVLGFLSGSDIEALKWVAQTSLAFIGFSAGGELSLKELRGTFRKIRWVSTGLVLSTLIIGSATVYVISGIIPFMKNMTGAERLAVSILAGAILVARSPSSAVAIIKELRAKGPFTQTALGVTVIMDAVVITLFAVNLSIADAIFTNVPFSARFIVLLLFEITLAVALGYAASLLLKALFRNTVPRFLAFTGLLALGYGVFFFCNFLRHYSARAWSVEVLIEPLLICMLAGFLVRNTSSQRNLFQDALHRMNPGIFLIFFTLVGASMAIDTLGGVWLAALILFLARLAAIFAGSFAGALSSGEPGKISRLNWMAYVTQAGVGLGLAQEVAVEFPAWGTQFATMMIAVIVLNQFAGPFLFKHLLTRIKEAHPSATKSDPGQFPLAVIFGINAQTMALAMQLRSHNWQVNMVGNTNKFWESATLKPDNFLPYRGMSRDDLESYGLDNAGAAVLMMKEDNNYALSRAIRKHYDNVHQIAVIEDMTRATAFGDIGVDIVNSATAMVSLLDHYVRSPSVVSLLMGRAAEEQEVIEISLENPSFQGKFIRDLELPGDVLFLGIRKGQNLRPAKGGTVLHRGDQITVAGSREDLDAVRILFRKPARRWHLWNHRK